MPTITRTVTTGASVEDAFAFLADFSNAPAWDPGTVTSVPREEGGPKEGLVYDLVVAWGDRRLDMTYTITEFEPNAKIVLVGEGSTTKAVDTMTFVAVPDGGSAVTYQADISLKGALRLAEPFLGKKFTSLGDEAEAGILSELTRISAGG
jgi:hypothetical protein